MGAFLPGAARAGGAGPDGGRGLADPHLESRRIVHRHDARPEWMARFAVPLAAFKFAHGGPSIETPPPAFGADTESVLGELGYAAAISPRYEPPG